MNILNILFIVVIIFCIYKLFTNIRLIKEKYNPNDIITTDPNSMFYNWTVTDFINILEPTDIFDIESRFSNLLGIVKYKELEIDEINGIFIIPKYNLDYNLTTNQNQYQTRIIDSTIYEQGRCDCCYAFVLTNALDCVYSLYYSVPEKTILNIHFSPQQLIDCFSSDGGIIEGKPAKGCTASNYYKLVSQVFDKQNLLVLDSDYPYISRGQTSKTFNFQDAEKRCIDINAKIQKETDPILYFSFPELQSYRFSIETTDDTQNYIQPIYINYIKKILYTYGCILFGYNKAAYKSFVTLENVRQVYVLDESQGLFTKEHFTHAMLLVGWTIINGINCWIVKNTWKKTWADNGYVYFNQNENIFSENRLYVLKPTRTCVDLDNSKIILLFKNAPKITIQNNELFIEIVLRFKIYRKTTEYPIKFFINNMYIDDINNCIYYKEKQTNSYSIVDTTGTELVNNLKYYYKKDDETKAETIQNGYYFKGSIKINKKFPYNNAVDIKGIWNIVLIIEEINLSATLYLDWSEVKPE